MDDIDFGRLAISVIGVYLVLMFLVLGVLGLGRASKNLRSQKKKVTPHIPPLSAKDFGLVHDGLMWKGEVDGLKVLVHPPNTFGRWTAIVDLPFDVPVSFQLLDEEEGNTPSVAATPLVDDAVRSAVEDLLAEHLEVHVANFVSVTTPGAEGSQVAEQLRRGIQGAAAITRALTRRHAEVCGETPTYERLIDGVLVHIDRPRPRDGMWELRVSAALLSKLPPDTRIARAADRFDDIDIGDLFLDTPLDIATANAPGLRRRIARDDIRGPLLELLCEYPKSVILSDQVVHVVRGPAALDIEGATARVVELVNLLR